MRRRTLLGVIALFGLTVSCIRPEATLDTEPLAPPDSLSSSTTVTTQARTTTTVDVERAAIYPVDPITLDPIEGFDPIPMGDWFDWYWSAVSSNGSWLTMTAGNDNSDASLRLINLDRWETAGTWTVPMGSPLRVSNDGTVVIETFGGNSYLASVSPGSQEPMVVAELPPGFFARSRSLMSEDRAMMFGVKSTDPDGYNTGESTLVIAELSTGEVTEVSLPMVETGIVAEVDIGEEFPGLVDSNPAMAWDRESARVFIVHATRDVVTEVDLVNGEVTEHQFGTDVRSWGPLFTGTTGQGGGAYIGQVRTALLSHDGAVLYVASSLGEFDLGAEGWSAITSPTGIVAIDTETWEIDDRLDAPISDIHQSPAGDRLLATGSSSTEGMNISEYSSSGFYVIDPVGLEVIAHHESDDPQRYFGGFSFSKDSALGYVSSWGQQTNIDVVELETGEIIHTRSDPEIQIFGEVGILGEVQQGP